MTDVINRNPLGVCLSFCPPGTATAQLHNFKHVKHPSLNGKGGLSHKLEQVLPFWAGMGTSGGSSNFSVCTRASGVILVPAKMPLGKELSAAAWQDIDRK